MTTTNITVAQVRQITGIDDTLVSDTDIQDTITRVCEQTDSFFNIKTTPTKALDFLQVVDEFSVTTKQSPLLSINKLKQNQSNIDLQNMQFNENGTIRLDFRRLFNNQIGIRQNNLLFVDYYYGWVEDSDTQEMLESGIVAGDDVNIPVADSTKYAVGDWIRIKGFDGNQEVAKVTVLLSATSITVDKLVFNHEVDSLISLLQIPSIIDQFILYESGLTIATQAVGASYTFATSYTMPEYSVVKGVPYPHFEKVVNSLTKQRDILKSRINASLIIVG